jgi:acetoin utilization deacetylase AcuC-like enzyme
MATGLIWDEKLMWHDAGNHFGPRNAWIEPAPHPESADSKRRIKNLLDASGLTAKLTQIAPRMATQVELLRVHTPEHVADVERISLAGGGNLAKKATTHIGEGGFEVACLAAGAAITAVTAVVKGTVQNAYALLRPPGHHAEAGEAMGFCVFNNCAVAAAYALDVLGLSRVAIIDIDAHPGNGAQSIFWRDPRVLAVSLHQENGFPLRAGDGSEQGDAAGLGYTLNIPLPAGSSEAAYLATLDRVVAPALDTYQPELILIACGLDAGFMDPTARMMLSSDSFRAVITTLMACANKHCDGRIVCVHEGGYHLQTVPFYALAVFETLSGIRTDVTDPFLAAIATTCAAPLQDHQNAAITRAEAALAAAPPDQGFAL